MWRLLGGQTHPKQWPIRGHDATHGRSLTLRHNANADLWWWSATEPTVTSVRSRDTCQGHAQLNISCQPNISTDSRNFRTSNGVNFRFSDTFFFYLNRVDKVILEQFNSICQQLSHVRRKNCLFRHLNDTCQIFLMIFYTIFKILYTQMSFGNNCFIFIINFIVMYLR